MTETQRRALEQRFGLIDGHRQEGTIWAYTLGDTSTANIRAIVQEESVDDTAQVNRRRFRPAFAYDRQRRVIVFAAAIGAAGAGLFAARVVWAILSGPAVVSPAVLTSLIAAPSIALAGSAAVVLALAAFGSQPLWKEKPPGSLAAAAIARDHVSMSRLIAGGVDPNVPGTVEINERVVAVTPLEAAVRSRDVATVALIVRLGGRVDKPTGSRLTCLAKAIGAGDIVEFLNAERKADASAVNCSDVWFAVD